MSRIPNLRLATLAAAAWLALTPVLAVAQKALVHEMLGRGPWGLASFISVHTGITVITVLAVKTGLTNRLLCWQIIDGNLKKGGWSLGWVSAVDSQGRTICANT